MSEEKHCCWNFWLVFTFACLKAHFGTFPILLVPVSSQRAKRTSHFADTLLLLLLLLYWELGEVVLRLGKNDEDHFLDHDHNLQNLAHDHNADCSFCALPPTTTRPLRQNRIFSALAGLRYFLIIIIVIIKNINFFNLSCPQPTCCYCWGDNKKNNKGLQQHLRGKKWSGAENRICHSGDIIIRLPTCNIIISIIVVIFKGMRH